MRGRQRGNQRAFSVNILKCMEKMFTRQICPERPVAQTLWRAIHLADRLPTAKDSGVEYEGGAEKSESDEKSVMLGGLPGKACQESTKIEPE